MATFPTLKTGVVAQYPAPRRLRFQNQVIRFLDGSEQRYRGFASALREWTIRLDLLDDAELAALRDFFEVQKGQFGSFTFVDPRDNTTYADCSFSDDRMSIELAGESRGRTTLVIQENRS